MATLPWYWIEWKAMVFPCTGRRQKENIRAVSQKKRVGEQERISKSQDLTETQ